MQSVLSLPAGVDRTRMRRLMRVSVLLASRRARLLRFVLDMSEVMLCGSVAAQEEEALGLSRTDLAIVLSVLLKRGANRFRRSMCGEVRDTMTVDLHSYFLSPRYEGSSYRYYTKSLAERTRHTHTYRG